MTRRLVLMTSLLALAVAAQEPPPFARGGRGPMQRDREIVKQFDADDNGRLDEKERAEARAWLQANPQRAGGPGGFGGPRGRRGEGETPAPPLVPITGIVPGDEPRYRELGFYDVTTLRTVFIDFPQQDWAAELADFYRTDVEVPARLIIDGKVFDGVGVSFRGNSSYFGAGGRKRSFNVTVDYLNDKLHVNGYRTLNFLNAHSDPSFVREVLFSEVARRYGPAPRANLVRVVVNGENHGVFVNVQQDNKEFLEQNWGRRKGARWKVPANFSGAGALVDLGDDDAAWKAAFQLRAASMPETEAWARLRAFCHFLCSATDERLVAELESWIDVDEALWFLALDNVFIDGDGYHSRGSDFGLYLDPDGRFHVYTRDNNETFRDGGGGPGRGPRRRRGDEPPGAPSPPVGERGRPGAAAPRDLDPLALVGRADRPLASRLFAIPAWRARYLAHVRTIVDEQLQWSTIGPRAQALHALIEGEVARDDKALYGIDAFRRSLTAPEATASQPQEPVAEPRRFGPPEGGAPPLESFVEKRRAFLLGSAAFAPKAPTVAGVSMEERAAADGLRIVGMRVRTHGDVRCARVVAHVRAGSKGPFAAVTLVDDGVGDDGLAGNGVFGGDLEACAPGSVWSVWIEAFSEGDAAAAVFPRRSSRAPIPMPVSGGSRDRLDKAGEQPGQSGEEGQSR